MLLISRPSRLLGACLLAVFLSLPTVALGQEGLVPECPVADPTCSNTTAYHPDNYGPCEVVQLANNIIDFVMTVGLIIVTIVIVYAGYLMVTSRGNPAQIQKAKGLFTNILIGIVILLSAFLIVNTVLSVLVGSNSTILNWNRVECTYSNQAGTASAVQLTLDEYKNNLYLQDGWVVGGGEYLDIISGGGTVGGGGTCSPITNSSNPCAVSNLSCFGGAASQASQICNIESAGGNPKAVSGTDLCKGGESFSGGLFQINILAHYDKLPGCSSNFFTKVGSGTQGDCLTYKGPEGHKYCAIRNCTITNGSVYQACMNATFDPARNISIACSLYKRRGNFGDWAYSANKCGIN